MLYTWTSRDVSLKAAKSRKLQSKCGVNRERAQGSAIKQEAEAMGFLAVELLEVGAAHRSWWLGCALHKWCTRGQWNQAWCTLGYGGAWGAGILGKDGG